MTSVRLVSEEGNTSDALVVLASAARTASANSASLDMSEYKEAVMFLDITAVLGSSPTLDIIVQRLDPRSSNWVSWDDGTDQSFSQKTATGTFALPLNAPLGDTIRANCTIAGSDTRAVSVTFADTDPDTITRASGSFITDGFIVGDTVVTGTVSNNDTFTIDTVAALTLTLDAGETVTAEGPVSATFTNMQESFTFSLELERKVI